jgi:hypothetical protein
MNILKLKITLFLVVVSIRAIGMRKVRIEIKETSLNKRLGSVFTLALYDGANVLYTIDKIDWLIMRRLGRFPIDGFKSLLHMLYDPVRRRFYEQVIMHASSPKSAFLPIRNQPELELEDGTFVRLILMAVCADAPEPVLKYEEFHEALSKGLRFKNLKANINLI